MFTLSCTLLLHKKKRQCVCVFMIIKRDEQHLWHSTYSLFKTDNLIHCVNLGRISVQKDSKTFRLSFALLFISCRDSPWTTQVRFVKKETGSYAVVGTTDNEKKKSKENTKAKRDARSDLQCLGQGEIDAVVKEEGSCRKQARWKQRRMFRLRVTAPNNTRVITI